MDWQKQAFWLAFLIPAIPAYIAAKIAFGSAEENVRHAGRPILALAAVAVALIGLIVWGPGNPYR